MEQKRANPLIPKRFADRYKGLVDDEKEFLECLQTQLPRAFRVNTLKAGKAQVLGKLAEYGIEVEKVGWSSTAFVTNSLQLGNTIEHFMGYIYIQELTSMLPAIAISDTIQNDQLVLDCCAAPGSKTTQLAAGMGNNGCIIANDINYMRIKALKFNLEKLGVLNTIVTNHDLRFFTFPEKFDAVFLDAPCSSEGTIRKDKGVLAGWSEARVIGMCRLQKQLILRAFDLLKQGGSMVYSTCTFAPEENEEVVQHLLDNREGAGIEKIKISGFKLGDGIGKWGKIKFSGEIQKTSRVWPQDNDTGGFFLAKVRKAGYINGI